MKPLLALRLLTSFKLEFRIMLCVLATLLALPFIAVVSLADAGIETISNALAFINPVTHLVELYDAQGKLMKELELATTWPAQGVVTLEFGKPDPPYQPAHTGMDIAGKRGDPITTFMPGKVVAVEHFDWGYGIHVKIDHGNDITSIYGHLGEANVTQDQEVKSGDIIGTEGDTGWAEGVHLHFEIRVHGLPVDPRTFILGEPLKPGERMQIKQEITNRDNK